MRNYKVYFTVYGKKMCTNVLAKDKKDAEFIVSNKIVIVKTEEIKEDVFNQCIDILDNINDEISKWTKK